jgi:hypothetical protein
MKKKNDEIAILKKENESLKKTIEPRSDAAAGNPMSEINDHPDWVDVITRINKESGWIGKFKSSEPKTQSWTNEKIIKEFTNFSKQIKILTERVEKLEGDYDYQENCINELNDWIRDVENKINKKQDLK